MSIDENTDRCNFNFQCRVLFRVSNFYAAFMPPSHRVSRLKPTDGFFRRVIRAECKSRSFERDKRPFLSRILRRHGTKPTTSTSWESSAGKFAGAKSPSLSLPFSLPSFLPRSSSLFLFFAPADRHYQVSRRRCLVSRREKIRSEELCRIGFLNKSFCP